MAAHPRQAWDDLGSQMSESTNPRPRVPDFALILLSALFQTASIASGKQAALLLGHFASSDILRNGFYFLSLGFLALQAVTWQLALVRVPLSYAYALMSMVYVFVLLVSIFVFHEPIAIAHVAGAALIIGGIVLMTAGRRDVVR